MISPSKLTPADTAWWTPERRQEAREKALAYQSRMTPQQRRKQATHRRIMNFNFQNSDPVERTNKNIPERMCEEFFKSDGFTVTKRGWPDFIVRKGNRVMAVEVKPSIQDHLKPTQSAVMDWLISLGVECYQWSPDGMREITSE